MLDTGQVATFARARPAAWRQWTAADAARHVVVSMGGRYSAELGIAVDEGAAEIERWFLAATLFGTRISAAIAGRTFLVLDHAGLARIADARHVPWDDLVALLDEGGYTRYDFRTATRLQQLADAVDERYGGQAAAIGRRHPTYAELRDALDVLPGWGPVTVGLFLRELRGIWPGAEPPIDERAMSAARHLRLCNTRGADHALGALRRIAGSAGLDLRDLESGLVRLALAHHRGVDDCPGGRSCTILARSGKGPQTTKGRVS